MPQLSQRLLRQLSRLARALPPTWRRRVADAPGVLRLAESLSRREYLEVEVFDGLPLVINPLFHSSLMEREISGGYEPQIEHAIRTFTRPGMAAYDIGANVGVFSFLFGRLVGDAGVVHAFEPEQNNTDCFRQSLARYPVRNVQLDTRAVGRAPGTDRFDRRGGSMSGRLVGDAAGYSQSGNVAEVETVSIDTLVEQHGWRPPDIVKIDVEGNEGMVLEGMRNTLARHHPVVVCELHWHLGDDAFLVERLLREAGYAIQAIRASEDGGAVFEPVDSVSGCTHIVAIKA